MVGQRRRRRRGPRLYDEQVVAALRKVWYLFGCLCGKRLVAVLRAQVPLLEKFGELDLDPDTRQKLQRISAATIDRLLRTDRPPDPVDGGSRRAQQGAVAVQALLLIRSWLPFALFFTEQKNNDVVRRHVGYLRLQTEQEVELLNELYDRLRLLVNFFYPSQKLVSKTRQGARVRRPRAVVEHGQRVQVRPRPGQPRGPSVIRLVGGQVLMVGLRGRAPPVRRGIPEMLDLGIHVIVARGGDHVHLRRGGAQVQRVERVPSAPRRSG